MYIEVPPIIITLKGYDDKPLLIKTKVNQPMEESLKEFIANEILGTLHHQFRNRIEEYGTIVNIDIVV